MHEPNAAKANRKKGGGKAKERRDQNETGETDVTEFSRSKRCSHLRPPGHHDSSKADGKVGTVSFVGYVVRSHRRYY